MILRLSKPFKKGNTLIILFNSYVRSVLEFGSVVWNPQYAVHKDRIEKIQNKFLKSLDFRTGCLFTNYKDSAIRHKIQGLQSRRVHLDTMFLYKIIHNYIDSDSLLEKVNFKIPRASSRSKETFHITFCKTNYAKNTFIRRSCSYYNKYLSDVDIFSCSLNTYKSKIGELLKL